MARLLIVEDDPDSQEVVATIVEHMGFKVDTVENGEQASDVIQRSEVIYDAILIDLALPGKDGWELLKDVLNNPNTSDTICIAMTAFHNSKLREQALHAGFNAYLPKPINKSLLRRALSKLL